MYLTCTSNLCCKLRNTPEEKTHSMENVKWGIDVLIYNINIFNRNAERGTNLVERKNSLYYETYKKNIVLRCYYSFPIYITNYLNEQ